MFILSKSSHFPKFTVCINLSSPKFKLFMFILSKVHSLQSSLSTVYDLQNSNSPYFPKFIPSTIHTFESSYFPKFILSRVHTFLSTVHTLKCSLSPKCILSKVNTLSKVHNLHSSYSPLHIHTLSPKFVLFTVHSLQSSYFPKCTQTIIHTCGLLTVS